MIKSDAQSERTVVQIEGLAGPREGVAEKPDERSAVIRGSYEGMIRQLEDELREYDIEVRRVGGSPTDQQPRSNLFSVVFPSATGAGRNVAVYLANAAAGSVAVRNWAEVPAGLRRPRVGNVAGSRAPDWISMRNQKVSSRETTHPVAHPQAYF